MLVIQFRKSHSIKQRDSRLIENKVTGQKNAVRERLEIDATLNLSSSIEINERQIIKLR